MANKFGISFDGWQKLLSELKELGETKAPKAAEEALKETFKIVTPKAQEAISPHHQSGRTESSLKQNAAVTWESPWLSTIEIGFKIRSGGLPSVFLMYGTPRMKPDRNLYNAFFGSAVRKQIAEAQKNAFKKVLG